MLRTTEHPLVTEKPLSTEQLNRLSRLRGHLLRSPKPRARSYRYRLDDQPIPTSARLDFNFTTGGGRRIVRRMPGT